MQNLSPHRRRLLIVLAAGGMAAYLALALAVDAPLLGRALGALGFAGAAGILALSLLNYGLRFARWSWYVGSFGHAVPRVRHLLYYLGGFAFTVSPGRGGEAVRALYLKRYGVPYSGSLAALFSERLLDAFAVTALATLMIAADARYRPALLAAAFALSLLAFVAGYGFAPALLRRAAALAGRRLGAALEALARLFEAAARLLHPRYLLPGLALGVIAWGAEGYGLFMLAHHMNMSLSAASGIGIYALAALAGAASFFMPGGLGGMEAAMTALLVAAGASLPEAFAITVLCRLATLWFAVALGILALLLIELTAKPMLDV